MEHDVETGQCRETERFVVLLTGAQREILRYILALLPDVDEAEEVLQETAVALWRQFDSYDPSRPFVPWACRFALRHVLKARRRAARSRRYLSVEVLERLAEERLESNEALESRRLALVSCVNGLTEDDRWLVEQRYTRRLSVVEMAETGGRNLSTLYKSLERVRRRLFECVNWRLRREGLL